METISVKRIGVIILLSLLAGTVGGAGVIWALLVKNLFGFAYSYPFLTPNIENRPVTIIEPKEVTIDFDVAVEQILNDVLKTTALIFNKRAPAPTVIEGAYLASEAIGHAIAVTSDGWYITATPIITEQFMVHIPSLNKGNIYPITQVIQDPHSESSFFKVAIDLDVQIASFAEIATLNRGETVIVLGVGGRAYLGSFLSSEAPVTREELIRSSEEPLKYPQLSIEKGVAKVGAHIYDTKGSLLAIEDSNGNFFHTNWEELLTNVLKSEDITRPYLGVHYLLLSDLISEEKLGLPEVSEGAWIIGSASKPPVLRLSPAFDAGLVEGDIILSVERESVTQTRDLDSLLSQYSPGQEITLRVITLSGNEEERTVVMGSY